MCYIFFIPDDGLLPPPKPSRAFVNAVCLIRGLADQLDDYPGAKHENDGNFWYFSRGAIRTLAEIEETSTEARRRIIETKVRKEINLEFPFFHVMFEGIPFRLRHILEYYRAHKEWREKVDVIIQSLKKLSQEECQILYEVFDPSCCPQTMIPESYLLNDIIFECMHKNVTQEWWLQPPPGEEFVSPAIIARLMESAWSK